MNILMVNANICLDSWAACCFSDGTPLVLGAKIDPD